MSNEMYIPDKTMWSGIGCDWMTHELVINVLQQGQGYEYYGQDNTNVQLNGWLLAEMSCFCYLTQAKKFSVGIEAIVNWMRMNYAGTHYKKMNLLHAMKESCHTKPENFVKFDFWYSDMLPKNKCFYNSTGKPFPLRFTKAMIKNIHQKVNDMIPDDNPKPLWIDVHWTLTETPPIEGGRIDNAELPSEIWTS
jgi:hypothetical protein